MERETVDVVTYKYLDSNVILAAGQPDRGRSYEQACAFLELCRAELVISRVTIDEVIFQTTKQSGKYRDIRAVRAWLGAAARLSTTGYGDRILDVADRYRRKGWDGVAGDENDRLHAAAASVVEIEFLITFEGRFIEQSALIREANQEEGITREVRITSPGAYLRDFGP